MRLDTRIEVTVLIVVGLFIGVWVGLRLTRGRTPSVGPPPEVQTGGQNAPDLPMSAPPAATPLDARQDEKPADENKPLPAAMSTEKSSQPPEAVVKNQNAPTEKTILSEEVAKLLAEGKRFEARALLTKQILAAPEGPQREQIRKTLNEINRVLFFSSRAPSPDCTFYKIKSGDALARIATKRCKRDTYFYHLLMRINNIKDPKRIRVGQKIKIPQGTFSALVQRRAHRLTVFLNGHYIKEYPVTVGAPTSPTPLGKFCLANNKVVKPPWYHEGNVYKYGDPRNILGTRWIGFEATEEYEGFGIHGTTDPDSIGKDASNGCIRMHNKDVEELFGMLMPGEIVEIRE